MKSILFTLFTLLHINVFAQQDLSAKTLFFEGMRYLKGLNRPYDPDKALTLFRQSTAKGYAEAMNAIANLHIQGIATNMNVDSALYWYNRAGLSGYAKAYYNVGRLYKTGTGVPQDFHNAVKYFKKGVALDDKYCKASLAYMYYKGLGISQNYNKAFELFKQSAEAGNENSMYFLGLCYRNGYGTNTNADLSKFWLTRAAQKYDIQAIHEFNEEPFPENLSVVSTRLENEFAKNKRIKKSIRL